MSDIVFWIYVVVMSILCLSLVAGMITRWTKIKSRELDLEECRFLADFNYDKNKSALNSFLDDFITDCMKDYVMYYITPDTGLTYITKERENKIRDGLKYLVVSRLSDSFKKKITMVYSDIFFNQILAEKIFYLVTVYVSDFNQGKDLGNPPPVNIKKTAEPDENDWGETYKK